MTRVVIFARWQRQVQTRLTTTLAECRCASTALADGLGQALRKVGDGWLVEGVRPA